MKHHSFPRFVPMLSCVTGAFILWILNDLAFHYRFRLCIVIWLVISLGLTTYCCISRTRILLAIGILQLLPVLILILEMSDPEPGPSSGRKRKRSPEPPNFLWSPMKKPKRRMMDSKYKIILLNIYKFILKTLTTFPSKTEITKQVAEIMGTSTKTVERVLNEKRRSGEVSSPERPKVRKGILNQLDDFTLTAIRRKVHQFFFNKELPTLDKVLKAVNDDEDLPSFSRSTLHTLLRKMNFKYMKRTRKSILLERPDLIVWCKNYLMRIKDYRKENKKIYYTDETWVNEGHTASYVWVDTNIESSRKAFLRGLSTGLLNPQKGKRLIITNIGSEEGFLDGGEWVFQAKKTDRDGDYHGEMDSHNFEKWFKTVLEKIEPGSVIVLDNAPYHTRKLDRLPNMSWRKADIQAWLQEKEIHFEKTEIKAQLITKIDKTKYQKKVIDEMAREKNIIVLRLPPYHCELNPIELIWAQLKSYVGRNHKTFKLEEVNKLVKEGLARIGADSWKKCIEHVIKKEDEMMRLDGILDTATDDVTPPFIIHVDEESDSSSESYDSDSDE